MASELIFSLRNVEAGYQNKTIFENLTLNIHAGEKISLVGRNGAGKTTLMKLITGDIVVDSGERWVLPHLKIGYLPQNTIAQASTQTIGDYIFAGLPPEKQKEEWRYLVDFIAEPLEIIPSRQMDDLSGGQLRRVALARSLVEEPDLLLLDEPTNHLDLYGVEWLENYLKTFSGAVLCISHDKTFLKNMSEAIFWLDRGNVRVSSQGFAYFEEWSNTLLEQEARELHNRQKYIDQEAEWANRGVKARVKRNVRRLEQFKIEREALKRDKSAYNRIVKRIDIDVEEADIPSNVVAEFFKVCKGFQIPDHPPLTILDKFSFKIVKGDRIGILGRNGSGKSTFLKLLLGEIEPDAGKVKRSKHMSVAYFDQNRIELDPEKTIHNILCPGGNDYIEVGGKLRHVCGYLNDFLFDPKLVHTEIATLSGGQQNRLMLAKVLAQSSNIMILDEPTNDLDMDTLEMLEDILTQYQGTLFIVSHDRDFLDQTVNKILAFEGNGIVDGYIGGYSDYLEAKSLKKAPTAPSSSVSERKSIPETKSPSQDSSKKASKLSYKFIYELEQLPTKIENLTSEIKELELKLGDSGFYVSDPEGFDKTSKRYEKAKRELIHAEERWLELESLKEENL